MRSNFEDQENIWSLKNIMFEIFQAGFVSAINGEDLQKGYEKYFDESLKQYFELSNYNIRL